MTKPRRLRWAAHVTRMEEVRSSFNILTGIPTGKRSLGRFKRRWKENIRMHLKEIGINTRNCGDSPQEPLCMCWTSGFQKPWC